MATDATGTPTSPDNIPTYNTAVDAPSGKGFNAAMASIQTALNNRISTPGGIATGEFSVWNGSAWVRSTVQRPSQASLATGSSGILTFLRGDGTWAKGGMNLLWDSSDAGLVFPLTSFTTPTLDQSFKHLLILYNGKANSASVDYLGLQFNGNTTANYRYEISQAQATAASAAGSGPTNLALVGRLSPNNGFDASGAIFIPNYSNASSYKPALGISFSEVASTPTFETDVMGSFLSTVTGAITTITFLSNAGTGILSNRYSVYGF